MRASLIDVPVSVLASTVGSYLNAADAVSMALTAKYYYRALSISNPVSYEKLHRSYTIPFGATTKNIDCTWGHTGGESKLPITHLNVFKNAIPCMVLGRITPILRSLRELVFTAFTPAAGLVTIIAKCEHLEVLEINCNMLIDISMLVKNCSRLTTLGLYTCNGLINVSALTECKGLTTINLVGCSNLVDVSSLAECRSLTKLDLSWCSNILLIPTLSKCLQLNTLNLSGCHRLVDISELGKCLQLTTLYLNDCPHLVDISALGKCLQLTTLNLSGCQRLVNISPLGKCLQLTTLYLNNCPRLVDISALGKCLLLTKLDIRRCTSLFSISALYNCQRLKIPTSLLI
jgi:Leucine-rich repeat (LRR) protein